MALVVVYCYTQTRQGGHQIRPPRLPSIIKFETHNSPNVASSICMLKHLYNSTQLDATFQQCTRNLLYINQCRVGIHIYTYITGEWITDTVTGNLRTGSSTSNEGISQVVKSTERIFSAVLDIEKSVFVSVLLVNLTNTGTMWHKQHHSSLVKKHCTINTT